MQLIHFWEADSGEEKNYKYSLLFPGKKEYKWKENTSLFILKENLI